MSAQARHRGYGVVFLTFGGLSGVLYGFYRLMKHCNVGGYLHPFLPLMLLFYALQSVVIVFFWRFRADSGFSLARLGGVMLFRILTTFVFFCFLFWRGVGDPYLFAANFFLLYLLHVALDAIFLAQR